MKIYFFLIQLKRLEYAKGSVMNMLDIQQIKELIPHRYPFLLVDKVTEMEEGERVVGYKNVTINEPFFQGHFYNLRHVLPLPFPLLYRLIRMDEGEESILLFVEYPAYSSRSLLHTLTVLIELEKDIFSFRITLCLNIDRMR